MNHSVQPPSHLRWEQQYRFVSQERRRRQVLLLFILAVGMGLDWLW